MSQKNFTNATGNWTVGSDDQINYSSNAKLEGTIQATDFLDADGNSIIGAGVDDLHITYDGESGWTFHTRDFTGNPPITFSSVGRATFARKVTAQSLSAGEGSVAGGDGYFSGFVRAADFQDPDGNSIVIDGSKYLPATFYPEYEYETFSATANEEDVWKTTKLSADWLHTPVFEADRSHFNEQISSVLGLSSNITYGFITGALGGFTEVIALGGISIPASAEDLPFSIDEEEREGLENKTRSIQKAFTVTHETLGRTVEIDKEGIIRARQFTDMDGNPIGGDPEWAEVDFENTSIGYRGQAEGQGAAVGYLAAGINNSSALGYSATAIGGSVAVGHNATAAEPNSVAIGKNAQCMMPNGIALGTDATADEGEFIISRSINTVNFSGATIQATDFLDADGNSIIGAGGESLWTEDAGGNISRQSTVKVEGGLLAAQPDAATGAFSAGLYAGSSNQGQKATALGYYAGGSNQAQYATALGYYAGRTSQQEGAVAIGQDAGSSEQGFRSIAIGYRAGKNSQSIKSISIGNSAGESSQRSYSIAIGMNAGQTNQGGSGIIISSGSSAVNNTTLGHIVLNSPNGSLVFNGTDKWEFAGGPVQATDFLDADSNPLPKSATVRNFVTLTQAQYDALSSKNSNTIYFIQE